MTEIESHEISAVLNPLGWVSRTNGQGIEMENEISVVIADKHPVFVSGIAESLRLRDNIVIQGQTSLGREAFSLISTLKPRVALIGTSFPDVDGYCIAESLIAEKSATFDFFRLTQAFSYVYWKLFQTRKRRGRLCSGK